MKAMVFFLFLISSNALYGQQMHSPADYIKSANWDIIASLKYDEKSYSEIYPVYSAQMKAHHGKDFELQGYIIPIQNGASHEKFLLSSLPINQCFYCGKNGVPSMVLVDMIKEIKYTLKPVKIRGTLKLEQRNVLDGYPVLLLKAKHVE